MVPENLLLEPVDVDATETCAAVPDAGLRSSRASSPLEHDLEGRDDDLDRLDPVKVAGGPSTLEVVTAESLDPLNSADMCPAPEGVAGEDSAHSSAGDYTFSGFNNIYAGSNNTGSNTERKQNVYAVLHFAEHTNMEKEHKQNGKPTGTPCPEQSVLLSEIGRAHV